jgi:hypothetical protein
MPNPTDAYASRDPSPASPARRAEAVTPSDTLDLTTVAKALYVGVAGHVRVVPVAAPGGAAVTFANHPVGYLPIQCSRVLQTGTTAQSLVALFD